MIRELDAAEIIAFCVKQKHHEDTFELKYATIREIAQRMERYVPSLLVTYDMVSIDAFRCEFSKHVVMSEHSIRITKVQDVYSRIQRYLPDPKLEKKMLEVETEIENL